MVADFGDISTLDFPNNTNEALWILNKYLTNDIYYENISRSLLLKSKDFDLKNETHRLMEFIENN